MKKLLHIVLYLPYGGLEKIVYDISMALNGKKYEVHVVALQEGGPMKKHLQQANIPVHVLNKKLVKFDIKLLINLIKLIRKYDIDVIHSHSGCLMYAALAGRLGGAKKIIHTEHGKYFPVPISSILEDRLFSYLITKYVCVSKELEKSVLKMSKIPKAKIETIINGIDIARFFNYPVDKKRFLRKQFCISSNTLVVGAVCRLIRAKNIDFLIKWISQYGALYKNIKLVIVGDGPQFNEWNNLAKSIAKGSVVFLGERKDVVDILNIFDIFVQVSITEGTSLTVLEAMATELPVVVSDVGGNSYIIRHGQNGYLFPVNDLKKFNSCLRKIIFKKKYSKNMGKLARKSVKDSFSIDNVVEKYLTLYKGKA